MFMFVRRVTHRKCAACFFFLDRGGDIAHAGDYTEPGSGFAVPLADDGKEFFGGGKSRLAAGNLRIGSGRKAFAK
jgi:hypothetical protein